MEAEHHRNGGDADDIEESYHAICQEVADEAEEPPLEGVD
jgi:hypothetical protein